MSILFFCGWELVIVAYNVCNKTPESILQITWGQLGTQSQAYGGGGHCATAPHQTLKIQNV